ncbi:protein ANTAGONIST OF LIKE HETEROCHROMATIN PROTEIN 1-like [Impatiens glandulifera]|uniref:protein ANTAGONIST OF LIKE HETEROCHROMATIN PROTEIN 1-like n=1 Tax=Impatiens glandulifera TaxID=253017 RepID=UPI001FB14C58|nr:protein ANTAGONIST OF LIKE HETEROCHROMATIN PROTEIN 1-like [Impatiens glandulifera]
MEVSTNSFLSQDDFNHLYSSLFTDFEEDINTNKIDDHDNNDKKKRRKITNLLPSSESSPPPFTDILSTLLFLEDNDQQQQHTSFSIQTTPHSHSDQQTTKRQRTSIMPEEVSAQPRRLWVKDRSNAWWEHFNNPDCPQDEFRQAFRMTKSTFNMICNELDSAVVKKNTMLRLSIPVRQRVAVCIWRLATGEPLRLVSKRFGLGISTCHKLVLEVCAAIKTVLMPKFLQWPDESRSKQIKQEFESISGIPNVGGSMYTTHIPIVAPKENAAAYLNKHQTDRNQKASYTITVQGVVDHNGVFNDVCIGWPGSMPDDKILEKSSLNKRAANEGLLKDCNWIVGSSNYPLTDWVLAPYANQNLTWTRHSFNGKIGEVQGVAKEAFGRLKGRWTCLQRRTEMKLADLPAVLGACCVLHNICEMSGEAMEPEFTFQISDDEMTPENPVRSSGAMQARDQIAHNLLHRNSAAFVL